MYQGMILIFETLILFLAGLSQVVGRRIRPRRNPKKVFVVVMVVVRFLLTTFLFACYGLTIYLVVRNEPDLLTLPFIFILVTGIVSVFTLSGGISKTDYDAIDRPWMSKSIHRKLNIAFLFAFGSYVILFGGFMGLSSILNTKANRAARDAMTEESFAIDHETLVTVDSDRIYLYSDFSSSLAMYRHDGSYIGKYQFESSPNGRATLVVWNDTVFIRSRSGTIFAYKDGLYFGEMAHVFVDSKAEVTVFDQTGKVSFELHQFDSWYDIVAFDEHYVYLDAWDGKFKTDGSLTLAWDDTVTKPTQKAVFQEDDYELRDQRLSKNGQVLITTHLIFYLFSHFLFIWSYLGTTFFVYFVHLKLSKLRIEEDGSLSTA